MVMMKNTKWSDEARLPSREISFEL